jgi:hypothetical protein
MKEFNFFINVLKINRAFVKATGYICKAEEELVFTQSNNDLEALSILSTKSRLRNKKVTRTSFDTGNLERSLS